MSGGISVVFVTYRPDPKFDWFADSLARQSDGSDMDVIIVDGLWSAERTGLFEAQARGRFPLRHVAAKPTPNAGPHRLTRADHFSAASARNTAAIYATRSYLVYADDLSVVMPGWWAEVQSAAAAGDVIGGAYQKRLEMVVDDGILISSCCEASSIDTRWWQAGDSGRVTIPGAQLYGCSFGLPLELMLSVNGFDELCDRSGGEDWHFGLRLEWSGATIRYSRHMLTIESTELHTVGTPAKRLAKFLPPHRYLRRLREFGIDRRATDQKWDNGHMIVDLAYGTRSTQTLGNYYLLSALTPEALPATVARFPRLDWFDDQPLSQM
jgi:glycosyltransferase involved in cell wall biosynthesis